MLLDLLHLGAINGLHGQEELREARHAADVLLIDGRPTSVLCKSSQSHGQLSETGMDILLQDSGTFGIEAQAKRASLLGQESVQGIGMLCR